MQGDSIQNPTNSYSLIYRYRY